MPSQISMREDAPGLVTLLERAYGEACIDLVSAVYEQAAWAGGNIEPNGLVRDEGVSFRPRLARIATLLIQEVPRVRLETVRAALSAAARGSGPFGSPGESSTEAYAVQLAIQLDTTRHLHMTQLDSKARGRALAAAEELLSCAPADAPVDTLRQKLLHAINLQRRNLGVDETAGREPTEGEA